MRSSERELLDVFEHASAGLAIGTPEGVLVRVNPALCELLGRSADELIGADLRDFTHPDDLGLTDQFRETDRPAPYEKRYVRPDGSVVQPGGGAPGGFDETAFSRVAAKAGPCASPR